MTKASFRTRLLVVHPDEEARVFLRRRFVRLGYEVVEAGEHAEALSRVAGERFDLALVDLQTKGADDESGLDLLRRMRKRRNAAELPILAVIEPNATEDAVAALACGADDCLFRPLHINDARARAEMLVSPRGAGPQPARADLESRIEFLEAAAARTDAVSAAMVAIGRDVVSPINGLLGASRVLTRVCQTPDLKRAIERIETAAVAVDAIMVRALGFPDRRSRAPKSHLRVLLADDDVATRRALCSLLDAAEVTVELVEVDDGKAAARATDASFYDLIVVNMAAPDSVDGMRAIRHAERFNLTRRTPMLAFEVAKSKGSAQAHAAGADLYMCGPVTAERLLGALADALARESEDVSAVA